MPHPGSYEVVFTPRAAALTRGLDGGVFLALMDVLQAIARDPWAYSAPDRPGDPTGAAYRWAPFDPEPGRDRGAAHVRVDDAAHAVHVYGVIWTG